MRTAAAIAALALSACSPNLVGDWTGRCEFNQYNIEVELELKEQSNKDGVSGDAQAQLIFTNGSDAPPIFYEGDFEGSFEDDELDIDLDVAGSDGTNGSFSIEAVYNKDKDEFEGECINGGEDGDIELEFEG